MKFAWARKKIEMTRTERLLREMKTRRTMSHNDIVQYLLDMRYGFDRMDAAEWPGYWNAQLYGTRDRTGVLERFCEQDDAGSYQVVRKISGPFTTYRKY